MESGVVDSVASTTEDETVKKQSKDIEEKSISTKSNACTCLSSLNLRWYNCWYFNYRYSIKDNEKPDLLGSVTTKCCSTIYLYCNGGEL